VKTSGAAPKLVAGNASAASLIAGAAAAQPGGTDNAPTEAARPRPAEPADPTAPNWSNRLIIRPSRPLSWPVSSRISSSPSAADAHAPDAVLNSDDPRPNAAGSNKVSDGHNGALSPHKIKTSTECRLGGEPSKA
jgi:hypothetical protein